MPNLNYSLRPSQTIRASLIGRLKLGQILSLPEPDFQKWVQTLEEDPWFRKLACPKQRFHKIIRFQRFSGTSWRFAPLELREEWVASKSSPDTQAFLEKYKSIFPLIQRIGDTAFRREFLYAEGNDGIEDLAARHGLDLAEVEKIISFVNDFHLHVEMGAISASSSPTSQQLPSVYTVAGIERAGDSLSISYHSLNCARGRYLIDYERLKDIHGGGAYSPRDFRHVQSLLKKLEMINLRKQTLNRILSELLIFQRPFFLSGCRDDLKPLSQREMARTLLVNSGVLCRVIHDRAVVLLDGHTVVISSLFLKRKTWLKQQLADLLPRSSTHFSDAILCKKLLGKTGVSISRRSISDYRRELGIPRPNPNERPGKA